MIKPTIGRDVWYRASEGDGFNFLDQPLAAKITYVHSDRAVNLAVFDSNGNPYSKIGVPFLQEGDDVPGGGYWEWPHQEGLREIGEQEAKSAGKDQATKTEDLAEDVRFLMEEKPTKPAKKKK